MKLHWLDQQRLQQQFVGYLRSHFIVSGGVQTRFFSAREQMLRFEPSSCGIPFVVRSRILPLNKPEEGRAATNLNKIIQVDVFVCVCYWRKSLFIHTRSASAPRDSPKSRRLQNTQRALM